MTPARKEKFGVASNPEHAIVSNLRKTDLYNLPSGGIY